MVSSDAVDEVEGTECLRFVDEESALFGDLVFDRLDRFVQFRVLLPRSDAEVGVDIGTQRFEASGGDLRQGVFDGRLDTRPQTSRIPAEVGPAIVRSRLIRR